MNYGPKVPHCDEQHAAKYRGPRESFEEAMNRVAGVLAPGNHYKPFRDILLDMRFMPGGRIQSAIGSTRNVTAMNCFVSGTIADSLREGSGSIMKRLDEAMGTLQMGGGIGYDFSTLRYRGAVIKKLGTTSAGPIPFMGMFDSGCQCISAAGHRRGAQMGVLRIDHPDIEEFIHAKQQAGILEAFNISIAITDQFMLAVQNDSQFWLRFEGKKIREVNARALWDMIMRSTWDWAEPGVIFIDRINQMNNLAYCETIAATNPCLAAGTLVSTAQGFLPVEDLRENDVIQTVMGLGSVKSVEAHCGVDVSRVVLSDGTELRATDAHIFHVQRGKHFDIDTRLDQLEIGDRIRLAPSAMPDMVFRNEEMVGYSDRDYGLIVGAVIGDGCYTPKSKTLKIACGKHEDSWLRRLSSAIPGSIVRQSTESCMTVESTELLHALDDTPLERGYSHEKYLPLDLLNSNENFLAGYIDGYISTDGNVHMSKSNPMVRVTSTSKESLMMLKRALSCFGILARIYSESAKSPDTVRQIKGRDVTNRYQGFVLVILGSGLKVLHDRIGLSHPDKCTRLRELILRYSLTGCTWFATVKSIQPDGKADVYDLFEPETDTWITDGVVNRGCGEQCLPPFGSCLLGSFNLVKYLIPVDRWHDGVTYTRYTFDFDQFAQDIPHVVRAMDRVIDVATYPLWEQEQEAKNKRRMGLGITALANTLEAMGYRYGSAKFIDMQARIQIVLRDEAYRASIELAKELGPFPLYCEASYPNSKFVQTLPQDIQDGIREHGIRNSHLLSIAPTGTISLCSDNVSSGIEPVFSYEVDRKIIGADQVERLHRFKDYGAKFLGVRGKLAADVTAAEHLAVLSTAQKYVDSAVSKTCNVTGDMEWEDFKHIYMEAWETGCKGCTTYNVDGKRGAVLTEALDEEDAKSCRIDEDTGRRECD